MTSPPEDRTRDRNDDRSAELRQLFFDSAQDLLQALNEQAMLLEKSPGVNQALRSLRRTVHTLKGDAAACGYRELSELAHELEDVLMLEGSAAAQSVPDVALRAADVFAAMLAAYSKNHKLPDTQILRRAIAELAKQSSAGKQPQRRSKSRPDARRWSEYERLAISQALSQGKHVYRISVHLDPQCGMPIAARQMLTAALSGLGEILAQPVEVSTGAQRLLEFAVATDKPAKQLRERCRIPTVAQNVGVATLRRKSPGKATSGFRQPTTTASPQTQPVAAAESAPMAPAAVSAAASPTSVADQAREREASASSFAGPDNILRVDAEKIDSVLNLVGELILAKSMLQQTYGEFSNRFPKDGLRGKFSDALAFQARVLNDLQRSVMKIRMVPVDHLFRRFPRVVRDVARQCGKDVDLIIKGEDTDLDKGILDAIAEPLTHLVRNAIGHGIESGDERVRAGKPRSGSLQLNAYHQGNQVVVEVSDDGHGVDTEKVRQRAFSQRLLTPEQANRLTETETLNLIFNPGFSTAEEITELSGRGVGLDVVKSVLERLKGTVQIETVAGRGTTFRLRLPLTLAIIKALLFQVEHRLYAIPLNTVAEIGRAREEDIRHVEHYEVLQLRNEVLPLLRLGCSHVESRDTASRKIFVLVIQSEDRKFGLIVDALEGEDELVIKALDDHSIATELVSGASILGNGKVVLILNLSALVERFMRLQGAAQAGAAGLLWSSADAALRGRAMAGGHA